MFKNLFTSFAILLLSLTGCAQKTVKKETHKKPSVSFYSLKAKDIKGNEVSMSKYKGKNILIVNTASECRYTYQYEGLEKLYKKFKNDLVVLGFPTNDFWKQEPGSNKKIEQFCKINYGVTFPLFSKTTIKTKDMSPIYQWLTNPELNGWNKTKPSWNFNKYLIDKDGHLVAHFGSDTKPLSAKITSLIK